MTASKQAKTNQDSSAGRSLLRWWISVPVFLIGLFSLIDAEPPGGSSVPVPPEPACRTVQVSGVLRPVVAIAVRQQPFSARIQGRRQDQSVHGVKPTPPAPPEPTPQVQRHVVRKGDKLWKIAERYLGSGTRWKQIVAANPGLRPNRLRVGDALVIPGVGSARSGSQSSSGSSQQGGSESTKKSAEQKPKQPVYHTVRGGDTLSHIAARYYDDGNWRRIFEANRDRIKSPKKLREGTRLVIPPQSG